jgi:hypothetical protein
MRETGSHYVATFEPEANERTGQMARLEIRTPRDGVTVRTAGEVAIPKAEAAAAATAVTPRQMLTTTASFTTLPLRAAGFASRGEGGRVNVLAMLEATEPGVKFTAVGAGLVDTAGKLVHSATADEKQLAAQTVTLALAGMPGTYRLRVAATDANGRSGAVDYTIDATLTEAGTLKFSSMILGAVGGTGCTPRLQFTSADENICAFIDMYGQPTAQMTATLEIVPAAGGAPVQKAQIGGSTTSQPDRFQLIAAPVAIGSLAPGDYQVRATIGMQGQADARIVRTLRKVK